MTTRLSARLVRVAAVTAMAGTTLAVPAAPAMAAPPTISILSVSSEHIKSGESVHVRFRASNNGSSKETVFVAVSGGLTCTAGCSTSRVIGPGLSETFDATLVGPEVHRSEISGRNLAVSVRIGTQTAFDHKMIYVHGADQPLPGASLPPAVRPSPAARASSAVSQVSGLVRDGDGKPVGGATLTIRDSAGHEYRTTSGQDGRFSIKSSDSKPIAAGLITVEVETDGYHTAHETVQGTSGGAATVQLTLAAVAAPSQIPPSPSAAAAAAPPAAGNEVSHEEESSPLWIILGGLVVAAGLGALALALIRRRNAPNQLNPPVPAPTMVNAPVGASGTGMADAPTAVMRTVPPDGGFSGPFGAATQDGNRQRGYDHGSYNNGGGYAGPAR